MLRIGIRRGVTVLGLVGCLSACRPVPAPPASAEPAGTKAAGQAAAADEPVEAAIGSKARLDLTLKDLEGRDVTLAQYAGKVILINFWATWCGPCKAEIPDLVVLQREHPDDLVVLGVVMMDTFGDKVRAAAKEYGITYPVLDGSDRLDVEQAYGPMPGLPTTVIIDRSGVIAKRQTGAATKQAFARMLEPLLQAAPTTSE